MNTNFCAGTTRAGQPCTFTARNATGLCINHDPTYKEQQRENVRRGAKRSQELREALPTRLTNVDLADRASVQAAIELVFRLYLLDLVSERRTRLLVRALGLAARNFEPAKNQRPTYRKNLEYLITRQNLNAQFAHIAALRKGEQY